MSTDILRQFAYNGDSIRTTVIDGEPWFVAKDVAIILAYRDAASLTRQLDPDEKGTQILSTPGGPQQFSIVNEPGLYRAIVLRQSAYVRDPDTRRAIGDFQRWVTHTVLPEIRRTGAYGSMLPSTFSEALELAAQQAKAIEQAEKRLADAAPKVEAYERLMDSDGTYSMLAVAKILRIGRTTLFRRLRDCGVIMVGSRLPYRRFEHHFKVIAMTWTGKDGTPHVEQVCKVRPSGLEFIMRKLDATAAVSA